MYMTTLKQNYMDDYVKLKELVLKCKRYNPDVVKTWSYFFLDENGLLIHADFFLPWYLSSVWYILYFLILDMYFL